MKFFIRMLACVTALVCGVFFLIHAQEAPKTFKHKWTTDADFDTGVLTNVNHQAVHDQIQLNTANSSTPFIWIANTKSVHPGTHYNQVEKLNTQTGESLGKFCSYGESPSRTAVADDGSVWVANRGFGPNFEEDNINDPDYSNVVHLSINGEFICKAEITGVARALAIDLNGDVWAGSWYGQTLTKISGRELQEGNDVNQKCKVLNTVSIPGKPYGAVVDGSGFLWTSNREPGTVSKINTNNDAVVGTYDTTGSPDLYGIAADMDGNIWLGNFQQSTVIKMNGADGSLAGEFRCPGSNITRGMAVDFNNFIWVANYGGWSVSKFDTSGDCAGDYTVEGEGPLGMAVDADGFIWAINHDSSTATKLDSNDGSIVGIYETGGNPYTYSDMTGLQRMSNIDQDGKWVANYRSPDPRTYWKKLSWTTHTFRSTEVTGRVRTAQAEADLGGAGWSGEVRGCEEPEGCDLQNVAPARWVQIEVKLVTHTRVSPVVFDVSVESSCFPEICDEQDNDCDGLTDEGPLCEKDGEVCLCGECTEQCVRNECFQGKSCLNDFCVTDPCCGKECEAGLECLNGQCVDPCATDVIRCGPNQECRLGDCVPIDCFTEGASCPEGQTCILGSCRNDPCASISCDEGQFCKKGSCASSCAEVECGEGELCTDGSCAAHPCGGVACGPGRMCTDGKCERDPCYTMECPFGYMCVAGRCVDDVCGRTRCPDGAACKGYLCGEGCVDVQCVKPIDFTHPGSHGEEPGGEDQTCDKRDPYCGMPELNRPEDCSCAAAGWPAAALPLALLFVFFLGRRRLKDSH